MEKSGIMDIIDKHWYELSQFYHNEILYMRKWFKTYREPNWKKYFRENYYSILRCACRYGLDNFIRDLDVNIKSKRYIDYAFKIVASYFDSKELYDILSALYKEKWLWKEES